MTIFAGEMPLFRRCDNAALACLNWVGRENSGAKARFDVTEKVKRSAPEPDRTHSIPTQRCQHLQRKQIRPSGERLKIENSRVAQGGRKLLLPTIQVGEAHQYMFLSCNAQAAKFTMKIEEDPILGRFSSRPNPMQLRAF